MIKIKKDSVPFYLNTVSIDVYKEARKNKI